LQPEAIIFEKILLDVPMPAQSSIQINVLPEMASINKVNRESTLHISTIPELVKIEPLEIEKHPI
jgi:hypothetical protein